MKKIISFVHKYGRYKLAIPILVVGFCLQYVLISYFLPEFLSYSGGLKNPDQLFSYELEYLDDLYRNLGTKGRRFYVKMLYVDFGYTAISALGYSLLLAALSKQRKGFILLPLLLVLFDMFENILHLVLMDQYPKLSLLVITTASTATSIKMIAGLISVLLILFYCVQNVFQWAISRRTKRR